MSLNRKMSDKHESDLADWFAGRISPGSGNQPANPMDVRQNRYETRFSFAIDGKSTRAKSISVTLDMLSKARMQAHGDRPMIALRFYFDDRLKEYEDWSLVLTDDLLELIEFAEER